MTKDLLLSWVEKIWKPFSSKFVRTLLILDNFSVHKTKELKDALTACNTDLLYIPSGLTYKLQPLDLYVNKAMKDKLRAFWEDYLMQDDIPLTKTNKIKEPMKETV